LDCATCEAIAGGDCAEVSAACLVVPACAALVQCVYDCLFAENCAVDCCAEQSPATITMAYETMYCVQDACTPAACPPGSLPECSDLGAL
jgi:hypothetical protein